MRAAFLAVGTELLSTDRVDTNSLTVTEITERYGVPMVCKGVVGDDEFAIAEEVRRLLGTADVLFVSGGLGPTSDDVTRPAVAQALDRELAIDEEVAEEIAGKFASHGLRMPEVNRRQAQVIDGARLITNRRGTAPGLHIEDDRGTVFLLPGVPGELVGMMEGYIEPWLAERSGDSRRERRTLKVACLPESEVEERIAPAYEEFGRETIAVLAQPGEIRVRLEAEGSEEDRRRRLDRMEERIRELVGRAVFATGEDASLEEAVGELLRKAEATVATAESCTGGLVAERFTRIAGSSDYFEGALVTYSNRLKEQLLGIPARVLEEHGAVSEEVARAMAAGARDALATDYGIGITGIAGPGGGSEEKPVGTVHIAVSGPGGTDHRRVRFPGDRERVRHQTGQLALELLRRRLQDDLGEAGGDGDGVEASGDDLPEGEIGDQPGVGM